MNTNTLQLLDKIYECQTACRYCFNACLEEENIKNLVRCIKLDVECADICDLTAASIAYTGDFTADVLAVCIKACEECAKECRMHDHIHCLECAKACQECADSCKQYLKEYRLSA